MLWWKSPLSLSDRNNAFRLVCDRTAYGRYYKYGCKANGRNISALLLFRSQGTVCGWFSVALTAENPLTAVITVSAIIRHYIANSYSFGLSAKKTFRLHITSDHWIARNTATADAGLKLLQLRRKYDPIVVWAGFSDIVQASLSPIYTLK